MAKISRFIDFEIIWKKTNSYLTKSEEETLKQWMMEDKRHNRFLENARYYKSVGSSYERKPADTNKALEKVNAQIKATKPEKKTRKLVYVSSIAAGILVIISLFVFLPFEKKMASFAETRQIIESGSNKARLILSDGSIVELTEEKEFTIKVDGTLISSEGTDILYVEESKTVSKTTYNTLEVPKGGEFSLALSDGTKVWLNSETTLRYPVRFSGRLREVELSGEAYFEVSRNEKMPFHVISGNQVVEVLGTSFNISSYTEDPQIITTLIEGKVKVFLKENPEENQLLLPNFQSRLIRNENRISQKEVDVELFTAWKEGRFSFKDQTLSDIMKILSRWYDVSVQFENEDAMSIRFTGDLMRYENFERILELIEKTDEVEFKIEGRSITVQ